MIDLSTVADEELEDLIEASKETKLIPIVELGKRALEEKRLRKEEKESNIKRFPVNTLAQRVQTLQSEYEFLNSVNPPVTSRKKPATKVSSLVAKARKNENAADLSRALRVGTPQAEEVSASHSLISGASLKEDASLLSLAIRKNAEAKQGTNTEAGLIPRAALKEDASLLSLALRGNQPKAPAEASVSPVKQAGDQEDASLMSRAIRGSRPKATETGNVPPVQQAGDQEDASLMSRSLREPETKKKSKLKLVSERVQEHKNALFSFLNARIGPEDLEPKDQGYDPASNGSSFAAARLGGDREAGPGKNGKRARMCGYPMTKNGKPCEHMVVNGVCPAHGRITW